MTGFLRCAFFLLIVRPLLTLMLGAHVRRRDLLPATGPAIIVANHNSHLDTLTILSMFRLGDLPRLRPVAAADYFLRSRLGAWFALNIIGIIPIVRGGRGGANVLGPCEEALDRGDILILFPEGSRGEPEVLADFKRGVAHLARARPEVPVHPLFLYGLGKALPKDSFLLVPFNCDIVAGEAFRWTGEVDGFMALLQARMAGLATQIHRSPWE
ncbi:MAG TPA: lysophospholipid acyltransferase family protein [Rhizomicrobium sp.]|jgi:1-acyl-sn-glycerol-3-phosphate acyltransferase|nr:lysophospholipid acyltransferase family protein [Rhizomicrobium sp.]